VNDEGLDRELRSLPRVMASPDFTRRVLARLDRPARASHPFGWRLAAASLAGIGLLLVGFGAWRWNHERQIALAQQELASLRAEHARIAAELRDLSQNAKPVVYLGGDENVDVVLDVERFMDRMAVQPVSDGRPPGGAHR